MKKTPKALIFLFLFISFATFVYSVPPVTTLQTSPTGTLSIVYPKNPYFEQYQQSKLHFHIYNSTGSVMTQTKINCSIHFYNSTGNHIIQQNMTWDSNALELSFTLNDTFTQEKRYLPYLVWCKGGVGEESGFVSSELYIGKKEDFYKDTSYLLPLVILIFIVISVLLYIGKNWKAEEKTSIMKLLLFVFVIWLIPLLISFMLEFATTGNFSDNSITLLNVLYSTTMWINITFTIIVVIYLFYNLLLLLGVDIVKSFKKKGGGR